MSFLGLDVGEKRIGVARSDELNFMAHPVGIIENRSKEEVVVQLKQFLEQYNIQTVVVGLPKTLKGEVGSKANEILLFVDYLRSELPHSIVTWDERLTTVEAERKLLDHDVSRAKRKKKRDALAAEIMLQSYLDYLKGQGATNV